MKPSLLYRIASGLMVFFAIAHTVGFLQTDPQWRVDAMISSMRTIHFDVQGFSRTYWEFFVGFGLFVTIFLLFAAILAWQLGGLSPQILKRVSVVNWSLAILFLGLTLLSWMYFFAAPLILCVLISVCLITAASLAGKQESH